MRATIRDGDALSAVSPSALSAYARASGWVKSEDFGDSSDVYVGTGLPEIIVPRTQRLGDYPDVVARLIEIFAAAADMDELALYRDLVTADRDITRVRAPETSDDGTIALSEGANFVSGIRDIHMAAACSLYDPRPLYRTGTNREANEILQGMRLGQTEQGSYVVTLLSPVIPPLVQVPLIQGIENDDDPIERRVSRRLVEALDAARLATEKTNSGDSQAFFEAVSLGVSANLCEALVHLLEPFREVEVSMTWARTRPMETVSRGIRFSNDDAPILREAARSFRSREPRMDTRLFGFVQRLKRDESETDGTITLRVSIDGKTQSVTAVLNEPDYGRAIEAHRLRAPIVLEGDLARFGQRWHLSNPSIAEVILPEEETDDQ